jgi:hypothetical protein
MNKLIEYISFEIVKTTIWISIIIVTLAIITISGGV